MTALLAGAEFSQRLIEDADLGGYEPRQPAFCVRPGA
jgi:hypothetical protein